MKKKCNGGRLPLISGRSAKLKLSPNREKWEWYFIEIFGRIFQRQLDPAVNGRFIKSAFIDSFTIFGQWSLWPQMSMSPLRDSVERFVIPNTIECVYAHICLLSSSNDPLLLEYTTWRKQDFWREKCVTLAYASPSVIAAWLECEKQAPVVCQVVFADNKKEINGTGYYVWYQYHIGLRAIERKLPVHRSCGGYTWWWCQVAIVCLGALCSLARKVFVTGTVTIGFRIVRIDKYNYLLSLFTVLACITYMYSETRLNSAYEIVLPSLCVNLFLKEQT